MMASVIDGFEIIAVTDYGVSQDTDTLAEECVAHLKISDHSKALLAEYTGRKDNPSVKNVVYHEYVSYKNGQVDDIDAYLEYVCIYKNGFKKGIDGMREERITLLYSDVSKIHELMKKPLEKYFAQLEKKSNSKQNENTERDR